MSRVFARRRLEGDLGFRNCLRTEKVIKYDGQERKVRGGGVLITIALFVWPIIP